MISEYSKYIPLERSTNEDVRYFVSEMNKVGSRIEQNAATLQAYTDKLAGTDIIRGLDKSYFDSKMSQAVSELSNLGNLNFNNTSSVLKAKKSLDGVLQDDRIKNSIVETANVRRIMSQWEKVRTDPKLAQNWHDKNYGLDMMRINDYISNPDGMAKLGISNATLYNGEFEKLQKLGRETKLSSNDFTGGYMGFTKLTVQETNKKALRNNWDAVSNLDNVARTHFEYDLRTNPELANRLKEQQPRLINALKEQIASLETQEKLAVTPVKLEDGTEQIPGFSGFFKNEIDYKKTQLASLESLSQMPEKEALYELYKEIKKDQHVGTFYTSNKKDGLNAAAVQQFTASVTAQKLNIDKRMLEIREDTYLSDLFFKTKELELKQKELSANGTNSGSGNTTEEGLNSYSTTFDLTADPTGVSARDTFEKGYSTIQNEYKNELNSLITFVKSMSDTDKEITLDIQRKLVPYGFQLSDIEEGKKVTPAQLKALHTVLDSVVSNTTGKSNSYINQVSGHLVRLSKISQRAEIHNLKAAEATEYAKTKGVVGSDGYEDALNEILNLQGQTFMQKKGIALSSIMDSSSGQTLAMRNAIQTAVDNASIYLEEDGSNLFTTEIDPRTKTKIRDTNRIINVDNSKTKIIGINPHKNTIIVNTVIKSKSADGVDLNKKLEIPIDSTFARQVSEVIAPNLYDKVIGMELGIETLLKNTKSQAARDSFSQKTFTTGGASLGLPNSAIINYKLEVLTSGQCIFKINSSQGEFSTNKFTSIADLEDKYKKAYLTFLARSKQQNANLSEYSHQQVAQEEALKFLKH